MAISQGDWVVCHKGKGHLHGRPKGPVLKFDDYAVGRVKGTTDNFVDVWLIGSDKIWTVPMEEVTYLNVTETGDKFEQKICNICHCLLPVSRFARNQRNKHGIVRRPSCDRCRTDIDKRAPKTSQARQMEKNRPKKGEDFTCPICQKRSIVGVTAKVVADHDRHTGNIRDFICDSCNTGLGRFKNGKNLLYNALSYVKDHDSLDP